MKSGILHIITIVLLIVNLVVSGLIMIVAVPAMRSTNDLIKQVSKVIDLDLDSLRATGDAKIPQEDLEDVKIAADDGKSLTLVVDSSVDGKQHYVIVEGYISIYTKAKDYKKLITLIQPAEAGGHGEEGGGGGESKLIVIRGIVNDVISSYSFEEAKTQKEAIRLKILSKIQQEFSDTFIVDFNFSDYKCQ